VPGWLLAGLAVVTLVVAGVALWVGAKVPSDQAVSDATSAAQSAAERAVVPILSYDAHHIEDSRTAAEQYLTSGYREKYDDVFNGIVRKNAPATGTVTTAKLVRSSIVRASDDATRVEVFVLVDQTRTNKLDKRPVVFKDWVTITMEKVGGDWLVAGMRT
jgi:Mce-associated membrane protein